MKKHFSSFSFTALLGLLAVVSFLLLSQLRTASVSAPETSDRVSESPKGDQLKDFIHSGFGYDCVSRQVPSGPYYQTMTLPESMYAEARNAGYLIDNDPSLGSRDDEDYWTAYFVESCKDDYGRQVALFVDTFTFLGDVDNEYFFLVQDKDGSIERYDFPVWKKDESSQGVPSNCNVQLSDEYGLYQGRRYATAYCAFNPSMGEEPEEVYVFDILKGEIVHALSCNRIRNFGSLEWKGERLESIWPIATRTCQSANSAIKFVQDRNDQ